MSRYKAEPIQLGNRPALNILSKHSSLIISAPNRELSRQYSQTFLDLLRTSSLLWGTYGGVTKVHGEGERCVAQELSNLARDNKCQIFEMVSESILSLHSPLLVREFKGLSRELPREDYFEPLGLVWEIIEGVLETAQQISRIQRVYPTRRKISELNLNSRKIGRGNLSDSEDEEK